MQVSILSSHLKAAACFSGDQDVCYYLNGVLAEVRATEIRLVATNGHCAAVLRSLTEQDNMPDVIIPNDIIKLALQKKSTVLALDFTNEKWSLAGIAFTPVEGKFPDYRRIIVRDYSGEAAQFDPDLVNRFAKAGKALGIRSKPIIRHNGGDDAQVQFYGCDDFVGVIMPLRAFTEKNPDLGLVQWGADRVPAAPISEFV